MSLSSRSPVKVGMSISLTGKYARLAQPAFQAAQMWAARTGADLLHYDDGSSARRTSENARRLIEEDHVDLLLGPYSSGLTRAVADVAQHHGRVLWNHGGASDDIADPWLVSTLSPASRYFAGLPGWLARTTPGPHTIVVIRSDRGSFARHVAEGLSGAAAALGYRVEQLTVNEPIPASADVLVLAGTFEDDVRIIRSRPNAGTIAAVAAGVAAFGEELGPLAEGVIGPSQWEPQDEADAFLSEFEQRFGRRPDYTAASAFATGLIIEECIRVTGSRDDRRLREAAARLDLETFYGRFRIDPATGRQIGHEMLLVRWVGGRKIVMPGTT